MEVIKTLNSLRNFIVKSRALTINFPDGSNASFAGSLRTTLSLPTITPGRSLKFAPYVQSWCKEEEELSDKSNCKNCI